MPVLVSTDEVRGTTTIRHSWRIEMFSEFSEDPEIRAHRQQVTYDTETGEVLNRTRDRIVSRRLSQLPDGPRETILKLAGLADQWEAEDSASSPA